MGSTVYRILFGLWRFRLLLFIFAALILPIKLPLSQHRTSDVLCIELSSFLLSSMHLNCNCIVIECAHAHEKVLFRRFSPSVFISSALFLMWKMCWRWARYGHMQLGRTLSWISFETQVCLLFGGSHTAYALTLENFVQSNCFPLCFIIQILSRLCVFFFSGQNCSFDVCLYMHSAHKHTK